MVEAVGASALVQTTQRDTKLALGVWRCGMGWARERGRPWVRGLTKLFGTFGAPFLPSQADAVVDVRWGPYPHVLTTTSRGTGRCLHKVPLSRGSGRTCRPLFGTRARQVRPQADLRGPNPDKPHGAPYQRADELRDFIAVLPPDCVLLLDEAYIDFAPEDALLPLEVERAQVVRLRTFSKVHGMAGARVGYALAHRDVVAALDKVRNHFGVNRIAQAGALASLGDDAFVRSVVRQVEEGRREYGVLAAELGLQTVPSATNFVALDVGSGERARRLMQMLLQHGVFVRMPGVAPLNRCIRVTVGPSAERQAFAKVLCAVLPQLDIGDEIFC